MQKKITASSRPFGLGYPQGRNLFKLPSSVSAWAERLAAVVLSGARELSLFFADRPYSVWSSGELLCDDCREDGYDCLMDEDGNLYVVYSLDSTGELQFRKITWQNGVFSVGTAVPVVTGESCQRPSIARRPDGTLWISYTRYEAPNMNVHVKFSVDDGATWGSGSSDPGQQLTSGYSQSCSRLCVGPNVIYAVYSKGSAQLACRSVSEPGDAWSSEQVIATGTNLGTEFDASVRSDGILAVAWDDLALKYREYDSANWGAIVDVLNHAVVCPQVLFRNNVPAVAFLMLSGPAYVPQYVDRSGGVFSEPKFLDDCSRKFESVLLYCADCATFEDRTEEADSVTPSDVIHSYSQCTLGDIGDALYLGMDKRFRYAGVVLTTAGSGGIVTYSYWNGSTWCVFTLAVGGYHFDAVERDILLWDDLVSIPSDWQKRAVDSRMKFWIKVEVTSAFVTPPICSVVAAVSDQEMLSFRR
jgi:hypothetical protein